jgi:hypothetical protein
MSHRLAAPGMIAHIDSNRAIVGTNPALHTPDGVWDHLSRGENDVFIHIPLEKA